METTTPPPLTKTKTTKPKPSSNPKPKIPMRQIRAHYDSNTITVYQAYSKEIATAAVENQNLSSSGKFSTERMTWIKPSWSWMMYRSGYSYKDARQERILALTMTHAHFTELLSHAKLAHQGSSRATGGPKVIVQWDPERGPALQKYDYRSIQIGISGRICKKWVDEWIAEIRDVTDLARDLKKLVDERPLLGVDELVGLGLMPLERAFDVPLAIARELDMVETEDVDEGNKEGEGGGEGGGEEEEGGGGGA